MPAPFGPMIAWRSPAGTASVDAADDLGLAEALVRRRASSSAGAGRSSAVSRIQSSISTCTASHCSLARGARSYSKRGARRQRTPSVANTQASARVASNRKPNSAHAVALPDVQRHVVHELDQHHGRRSASASAAASTPTYGSRRRAELPELHHAQVASGSGSTMPPGANITISTKNSAEVQQPGLRELGQRHGEERRTRSRRGSGRRRTPTPPMKAASSTPPERIARHVLGGDDLEVDGGQRRPRCRRRSRTGSASGSARAACCSRRTRRAPGCRAPRWPCGRAASASARTSRSCRRSDQAAIR